MLKVNLIPVASPASDKTTLEWNAPVLTVNDEIINLESLFEEEEGGVATASDHTLRKVVFDGEDYTVDVLFPYGFSAPKQTRFPEQIEVIENGPIQLPPFDHKEAAQ